MHGNSGDEGNGCRCGTVRCGHSDRGEGGVEGRIDDTAEAVAACCGSSGCIIVVVVIIVVVAVAVVITVVCVGVSPICRSLVYWCPRIVVIVDTAGFCRIGG